MVDEDSKPLLAITPDDPAGIGPEIILKALAHADIFARCRPLVIGDRRVLERAAPWVGQAIPSFEAISSPRDGAYRAGTVPLLDLADADPAAIPVGVESAAGGRAAVEAVFRACDLTMAGETDAVVTAPLNKAAMHMAGFRYPGHTELLAERTGAGKVTMLLTGPNLRVVHVSMHVGLAEAIARVTTGRVLDTIRLADAACRSLGIARPRIAVAGLNPHAREGYSASRRRWRLFRQSKRPGPRGWMSLIRSRLTLFSCAQPRARTTSSWRCTTIRAISR